MSKFEIIKGILENIENILKGARDLGGSFNADTLSLVKWAGIETESPVLAFLINGFGLYIAYRAAIKFTDDLLFKILKGFIALLFILMGIALFF